MSEWGGDSPKTAKDADRIALDSEAPGDLDEALKEAVEAVEAVERERDEERPEPGTVGPAAAETVAGEPAGALRAEIEELREKTTRTLADFDNYRKRVEREKQAQLRYDGMEVLRGLLDIVDNLERALESEGAVEDLKAGVDLTLRQAASLLQRHGVERIEAADAVFDPTVHEAVARHEEEDLAEPRVTAVLQSGYRMHDRLLRPVRVAVAVPAQGVPETGEEEG